MIKRKSLSRSTRFEVFKRDSFTCQYCGRHPPAVVLEVDHIVAVRHDGGDDDHNLITACFDCNRGKGKKPLDATSIDVSERAALLEERIEQVRVYDDLLCEQREHQERAINDVVGVYERTYPGWTLLDRVRPSIRNFLRKLAPTEIVEAMEVSCARMDRDRAFRYFCGVCWNKIRTISEE